jgi:hypothetical protein
MLQICEPRVGPGAAVVGGELMIGGDEVTLSDISVDD